MPSRIVVFDGECALCNGFVAWLIRRDRRGEYLIAGSAGDVGRAVIAVAGLPEAITRSTIVLWDGERALIRSDAVLGIARRLPLPWRAASALRIVPRALRDRVYRFVAARRPRMSAEDPSCGVPPRQLVTLWRSRLASLEDVRPA